jgi:TonB family protein
VTGRSNDSSAAELSRSAPPDILLGRLHLWIAGPQGWEGWLDVAVRVGDAYNTIADTSGLMIQKKDLIAFEPALRAVAEAAEGEALLRSDGGSVTVRVKRFSRDFGNHVEVGLRRSIYDQKISFAIASTSYAGALVGLRAVLTRLEEELRSVRAPLPLLEPAPGWAWPARQNGGGFGVEDYPAEALERNEMGVVEVDYLVTCEGEPCDIRLVGPSGSEALDSATLAIIAERFRYEPAVDAQEAPVAQRRRRKVAWLQRRDGPVVLDAAEVDFRYDVDGVGWFGIDALIGTMREGFGGSSWMTDGMGDLLRAGTALAGGVPRVEILFNAEPSVSRLEFEVEVLNSSVPARNNRWTAASGCWIRLREIDHQTGVPKDLEFEALCFSPLAVAEAIYRMALPLFEQNDRGDVPVFAALVAAIEAARAEGPREPPSGASLSDCH